MADDTGIDWTSVNWHRPTCEIARELGVVRYAVTRARAWYAAATVGKFNVRTPSRRIDWSCADWEQTDAEIALDLGAAQSTVSIARKKHAPETIKKVKLVTRMTSNRGTDWSSVDWKKANCDLARKHGVTAATVSVARKRHAPDTVGKREGLTILGTQKSFDWSSVDWDRPNCQLSREMGTARSTVSVARKKHAPETVGTVRALPKLPSHRDIDWSGVDWNCANRDIAREKGVTSATVTWARRKFAPQTLGRFKAPRGKPFDPNVHWHDPIDWTVVRWDRSDNAIARELRASHVTVAKYRRIHAPETLGVYKGRRQNSSETAAFRLAFTGRPADEILKNMSAAQLRQIAAACATLRESALAAMREMGRGD
jgi:hypothetical protein